MSVDVVLDRVQQVAQTCATPGAEREPLVSAMTEIARFESWAAARRADLIRQLTEHPGSLPEADMANTTGCTITAANVEGPEPQWFRAFRWWGDQESRRARQR